MFGNAIITPLILNILRQNFSIFIPYGGTFSCIVLRDKTKKEGNILLRKNGIKSVSGRWGCDYSNQNCLKLTRKDNSHTRLKESSWITRFFMSNNRLKSAKNQAKAKQHPQLLIFDWLFAFFIHVIIQN